MSISALALSLSDFPYKSAIPYSVTTNRTCALEVTTPAPCLKNPTILLSPFFVVDGIAIIGLPPFDRDDPYTKSTCPPNPENIRGPIESLTTCPVRSISMAELMATILGICAMTKGSLVNPTSRMRTDGLLCTNRYVFSVPITKQVVEHPRSSGFYPSSTRSGPTNSLVMAPDWMRSIIPSENISLCTPRPLWPFKFAITESGITPIPACSVEPSSTRLSAISFPICSCTSSCSAGQRSGADLPGSTYFGMGRSTYTTLSK